MKQGASGRFDADHFRMVEVARTFLLPTSDEMCFPVSPGDGVGHGSSLLQSFAGGGPGLTIRKRYAMRRTSKYCWTLVQFHFSEIPWAATQEVEPEEYARWGHEEGGLTPDDAAALRKEILERIKWAEKYLPEDWIRELGNMGYNDSQAVTDTGPLTADDLARLELYAHDPLMEFCCLKVSAEWRKNPKSKTTNHLPLACYGIHWVRDEPMFFPSISLSELLTAGLFHCPLTTFFRSNCPEMADLPINEHLTEVKLSPLSRDTAVDLGLLADAEVKNVHDVATVTCNAARDRSQQLRGFYASLDFMLDNDMDATTALVRKGLVGVCSKCGRFLSPRPRLGKKYCSVGCRKAAAAHRDYQRHRSKRLAKKREWHAL